MALIRANTSGSGGSGGSWTDIKASGVTGTVEWKKVSSNIFALHVAVSGINSDTYVIVGTITDSNAIPSSDMYMAGMNGKLNPSSIQIKTTGAVRVYNSPDMPNSASKQIAGDVLYTV